MAKADRLNLGVFGKQNTGKTTILRALIPTARRPCFIADRMGEFPTFGVQYDGYETFIHNVTGGLPNDTGVYVVNLIQKGDGQRLIDTVRRAEISPSCMVIDEVDAYTTAGNVEVEGLHDMAHYGAHWEQDLYVSARRPQDVAKGITSNLDVMVCAKTTQPRDVRRIYNTWGHEYGDPEKVRSLDIYDYMAFGNLRKYKDRLSPLIEGVGDAALANLSEHDL
jgi:hypothetical protein